MKKNRTYLILGTAVLMSSVLFAGCTKYATPEELAALDSKNAEIKKLRDQVTACNNANSALNSQIADAESQLRRAQDDKAFVERGLTTFNPAAFAPKPVETPKKKGKK